MHIRPFNKLTSLKGFRFFQNINLVFKVEFKLRLKKMYFKLFQLLIIFNYVFI